MRSPRSGGPGLLEDAVRAILKPAGGGAVVLCGPPGSGKTTALRHLAALLPPGTVRFVDDAGPAALERGAGSGAVVFASSEPSPGIDMATLELVPWGDDELIEFLLASDKARCASVMDRLLAAPDRDELGGRPELCRIVLEQMIADDAPADVESALRRFLDARLDGRARARAGRWCLEALLDSGANLPERPPGVCDKQVRLAMRHRAVQAILAAEVIREDLRRAAPCEYLVARMPRALVRRAARAIGTEPALLDRLATLMQRDARACPTGASILHATGSGWDPSRTATRMLRGAWLDHASWPGLRLARADLTDADLSGADLSGAHLAGAVARRATLRRATLRDASILRIVASRADLSGADLARVRAGGAVLEHARLRGASLEGAALRRARLEGADLRGASFAGAELGRATLEGAAIEGADFSSADLAGAHLSRLTLRDATFTSARFAGAVLRGADLEGMELPGADFGGADLAGALLTASRMPDACLRRANLRGAGLAEIGWERADLRGADLRGATFHMGSSRSGLLVTTIASEGTRTGFYTDDSAEQHFKAPEEVRKADLRGADLRGARIEGVDFYLVDLRGAAYTAGQERHLRRCRAILEYPPT